MHITNHSANHAERVGMFIETFWNRAQTNSFDDFLTPTCIDHAYRPANAQGLLAIRQEVSNTFPDVRQYIDVLTVQEGRTRKVQRRLTPRLPIPVTDFTNCGPCGMVLNRIRSLIIE